MFLQLFTEVYLLQISVKVFANFIKMHFERALAMR